MEWSVAERNFCITAGCKKPLRSVFALHIKPPVCSECKNGVERSGTEFLHFAGQSKNFAALIFALHIKPPVCFGVQKWSEA